MSTRTVWSAFALVALGLVFSSDASGAAAVFTRDAAGRITKAALSGGRVITYTYDAAGNRTRTAVTAAVTVSSSPTARVVAAGPVRDVFTPANLTKTYGGRLTALDDAAEALARAELAAADNATARRAP